MKKKTNLRFTPGKYPMLLLKLGLAPISFFLLVITAKFCEAAASDPAKALLTYPDIFSIVLGSSVLLIFGVIALEILGK